MVKEDYVSFKLAKLLKEKGFNEPCRSYYIDGDYRNCASNITLKDFNTSEEIVLRPTHQTALAWLRKKYIFICIVPFITTSTKGNELNGYEPWVTSFKALTWFNHLVMKGDTTYIKSYGKATEIAIKYALKNLI